MDQNEHWLLLSQYAQKYNVSVSTLRRRIKKQNIECKLIDNKYYIKDVPPEGRVSPEHHQNTVSDALKEILNFCQNLIQEKEKIYQDILKDKTKEMMYLKERISEQKMLIKILEDRLSVASAPRPSRPISQ